MSKHTGKIVAVSGGFEVVHIGTVRLLAGARKLVGPNGWILLILNNDNWLRKKRGSKIFVNERERTEVLRALRNVDELIITKHPQDPKDMSVCNELRTVRPGVFANGGDRNEHNIPEYALCNELGIALEFNVGGKKVQSSSNLLAQYCELP